MRNKNTIESCRNRGKKEENEYRQLAVNKKITTLGVGCFEEGGQKDCLLIGTETNILAYDMEKNADVFYRDVPDGVKAMAFGKMKNVSKVRS